MLGTGHRLSSVAVPARFEIVRRIGEGGMGVVYEARDLERGSRVALKVLIQRDPESLARFKREFRALQGIHHPNLVELGELVSDENGAFFTMELVPGVDLRAWVTGAASQLASALEEGRANGTGSGALRDDFVTLERPRIDPLERSPLGRSAPEARRELAPAVVAEARPIDEPRLRDAFRQVAWGLIALHDAGKIHRDIKPSNVRVTPEGRVVLLDFGLVFEVDAKQAATDANIVGTPAYMAPEQGLSAPVGPEADWYAVGVMLYEFLTRRLPFEGAAVAVLMAKHYHDPPTPSSLVAGIPRDLEQLCIDLLQFDPGARPRGAEVARRFAARPTSSSPPPASPLATSAREGATAPLFVGRAQEMDALRKARADFTDQKRAVSVVLYGESGVGKSSLARRFLQDLKDAGALVLAGRCYEREAVPYKAFDEVIDTLSRWLARLPREEVLALLPSRIEALAQLFPALGRVAVVAQAGGAPDPDRYERRRTAFRALRELLRRVARIETLVVAIDDLQWTDADSMPLLTELLMPPEAPPLLLVVTMRSSDEATNPSSAPKLARRIPGDVRAIHVGRLEGADATDLARQLLERRPGMTRDDAIAIAAEAGGHPLFIDELVRHASTGAPGSPAGALRLDDVLWARASRLDLGARRVLEVVCLLGAPVAQEVVATAAALELDEFARAVTVLRNANLVSTAGARVTDTIEPFHDRVREAVSSRLDPDAKRECHLRLAAALELAKGSDLEVLSTHWAGAGEHEKAARYTVGAAERAAEALAFDRAARLFRRAIDWLPAHDPKVRVLREQLGNALANSGESALAAVEYGRAADGATPVDALDLRRRAAEQLLRAGEVRRGTDATREVLSAVGLAMPRTRFGVIVSILWIRFLLRVRGLHFVPRSVAEIPAAELTRVDVCWSVSCTLLYADPFSAALFQARHLLLALASGERLRIVRALAIEGGFAAAGGPSSMPRADRAFALARGIAVSCADPYADALVGGAEGMAGVLNLRFSGAIVPLESSIATFRKSCPGSAWEIATMRYYLFIAQFFACRYAELLEAQDAALNDALENGDRYAAVMIRVGTPNRNWIVSGQAGRARRELETALREWPSKPFHVMHFYALISEAYLDLYEGRPERALGRFRVHRGALRRSMILQLEGPALEFAGIFGRVALSVAAADARQGRAPRFREVDRCIRIFERRGGPVCFASAASLRAGRAMVRGQREEALAQLEDLAREEAEEAWLGSRCSRWVLAALRGEGATEVRAAKAALESRGIEPSQALIATQLPGLESFVEA